MKLYRLLYLFLVLICGYNAQGPDTTAAPDFNGDPRLCTIDPSPPSGVDRPRPVFPSKAEFTLERVEIQHVLNQTAPSILTTYRYLYDYDANKLIIFRNSYGFTDVEFFYYEILKKSIYVRGEVCGVLDIDKNNDIDGTSATQLNNGTWHIRPLNEFLLFSSTDPRRAIVQPTYIGQTTVRGIPVDQWQTCIVDKKNYATYRRIWSFAQQGFVTPLGVVTNLAAPVQALISASVVFPNGTQYQEVDEIFNVYGYRPGIIEGADQLVPPKGAFCGSGPDQNLISLRDAGIAWPESFSVRIEASSSRSSQWQRFHLRYDRGRPGERRSRRIRYDYMPPGAEDYRSVIHDYAENLTYTIDRRIGACEITRGVSFPDVNPIIDPISFFIKHESQFIFSGRDKIWAFNGLRSCRGNAIKCSSVVAGIDNFPPMVDADTGKPNGEAWNGTSMEYGWSVRAPFSRPPPDMDKTFDYPVYLFLRFYRLNGQPGPFGLRTEDIEYEFYEMSQELRPSDFDTSICYRSQNLEYLHVGFRLRASVSDAIDGNRLDKTLLESQIHENLVNKMQIKYGRVSDIEVYHENSGKHANVFFTLLGPTPRPESQSGVNNDEASAEASQNTLQRAIDSGSFQFTVKLIDDPTKEIEFQGVSGSLKSSKLFLSSHAVGTQVVNESYSSGAQAGGVIGGILVGLALGVIIAAIFRIVRKEPMPNLPVLSNSFSNPLPSISFYSKKQNNDAKATTDTKETSAA